MMMVIIEKNMYNKVVNGNVFLKVLLSWCFFIIFVLVVVKIIIDKLIRLIVVRCKVRLMIS